MSNLCIVVFKREQWNGTASHIPFRTTILLRVPHFTPAAHATLNVLLNDHFLGEKNDYQVVVFFQLINFIYKHRLCDWKV